MLAGKQNPREGKPKTLPLRGGGIQGIIVYEFE